MDLSLSTVLEEAFSKYPHSIEKKPRVAYAGTRGSYGEEAALSYFKGDAHLLPYQSFDKVFDSLKKNKADYGVLPIENSSTGSIAGVYDLLSQYHYYIVAEEEIRVRHCLLAPSAAVLEEIEEVYSHPQGFSQSQEFLNHHPQWKCIPYYNTAIAAAHVAKSQNPHYAAIASKKAGELYQLTVLAENINFAQNNITRFVIISCDLKLFKTPTRVSTVFRLPHKPGALYDIIGIFSVFSLNLCKIESRPLLEKPWEYLFFVDFVGDISKKTLAAILPIIEEKTDYFKFLGYYPQFFENN